MSFIQVQKNRLKDGREFAYVHLASSVWRGTRKPPKQDRIYLGRLDRNGEEIIISKGFPARFGEKIPLDELKAIRMRDAGLLRKMTTAEFLAQMRKINSQFEFIKMKNYI